MSLTETEQALEASKSLKQGEVMGLGTFRLTSNGRNGSSLKCVVPIKFCRHHGLNDSDQLKAWVDSSTGALILLPGGGDE